MNARALVAVCVLAVLIAPAVASAAPRARTPHPVPPIVPRPFQMEAALVVRNGIPIDAGAEAPVRDRLVSLGYSVTLVPWASACGFNYAVVSIVVVGSQTVSLECLAGVGRPLLNLRSGVAVAQGWGSTPLATGYPAIYVTDASHPATGGISAGWHTICTAPGFGGHIDAIGGVSVGFRTLAETSGWADGRLEDYNAVVVRDAAPKRAFLGTAGYEVFCQATAEAWSLFDSTVAWLAA